MKQSQRDAVVFSILPGLGRRRGQALLRQYGSCSQVLGLPEAELARLKLNQKTIQMIAAYHRHDFADDYIRRVENWLNHPQHHLILWGDDNYPTMLQNIPDPPLILYVRGNL